MEKPDNSKEEEEKQINPSKHVPLLVEYCPKCGLPFEYCEFDEKCNPKLKEKKNAAPVAPVVIEEITPKEEKKEEIKKVEEVKVVEEETKPKKKEKENKITLSKVSRNKKKFISSVKGLDKFNINVKDAAKKMGKKFACGASAISDDTIEIQGDILDELMEFILNNFPQITEKQIVIKEKSEKKKE